MRTRSFVRAVALAASFAAAIPAHAGLNSNGSARLSWSRTENTTDLGTALLGTTPLYVLLEDCADVRSIYIRLAWTPSNPSLASYCLVRGRTEATDHGWVVPAPVGSLAASPGWKPYNSTIVFPPGVAKECVAYYVECTAPGALVPADFVLQSVRVTDMNGDVDELAVLAGATILGGTSQPPPLAQTAVHGDVVSVTFATGAVLGSGAPAATPIDRCTFRSPALAPRLQSAGVVSLEKVFPRFQPGDVHSRNTIGEPVVLPDLSRHYIARLAKGVTPKQAITSLVDAADVQHVGMLHFGSLTGACQTLAQYFDRQWALNNTGQMTPCQAFNDTVIADVDVNAPEAWAIAPGVGGHVRVGVLDTGIAPDHDAFRGRVVLGANMDTTVTSAADSAGHGTAVASVIAAASCVSSPPSNEMAGIAPGVLPVAVRVFAWSDLARDWKTDEPMLARGIESTQPDSFGHPVQVLNMSLSFLQQPAPVLLEAIEAAFLRGQLLVASMGNNGRSSPEWPAAYGKPICAVGGMLPNGQRWCDYYGGGCSTYGDWIDLSGPAEWVVSAGLDTTAVLPSKKYIYGVLEDCADRFWGTSAAAPVVSGVAALLFSAKPGSLLGEDVQHILEKTARHYTNNPDDVPDLRGVTDTIPDIWTGHGIPRADSALKYLIGPGRGLYHLRVDSLHVVGQPWILSIKFVNPPDSLQQWPCYRMTRFTLRGTVTFPDSFLVAPDVWVRSSGSSCVDDTRADYGCERWDGFDWANILTGGRIVPGTLTNKGCEVEGVVYQDVTDLRWFPVDTSSAAIALSVLGTLTQEVAGAWAAPRHEASLELSPNPSRGRVLLAVELPVSGPLRLEVMDIAGRVVHRQVHAALPAGRHRFQWDGRDDGGRRLAPGVYFVRARIDGRALARRVVMLRSE